MFTHWTMPVSVVILECTAVVHSTGTSLVEQYTSVDKYLSKQMTKAFGSKCPALMYYPHLGITQQVKFQCQCQRKHEPPQRCGMQSLYMHLSLSRFRLDTTPRGRQSWTSGHCQLFAGARGRHTRPGARQDHTSP